MKKVQFPTTRLVSIHVALIVMAMVLVGCATQRPVLYPNETVRSHGAEAAERAVDECVELAHQHGATPGRGGEAAGSTVRGGAAGAASGAVVGAVFGDAGRGAAAGAAGGATHGLIRSLFGPRSPDPVFRNYVNRCLNERGYDLIGWE